MDDRNDQDYPFIKETIKQRPIDKRAVLKRAAVSAMCGIVFGLCAAVTISVCVPGILEQFEQKAEKQKTVKLSPPAEPESSSASEEDEESTGQEKVSDSEKESKEKASDSVTVEHIQNLFKMIQGIAEEPQKALVRVAGMTGDSDLLNDSLLTYGDEGGIVFLKNQKDFYIVTTSDHLGEMKTFWITFSNGDTAQGTLCGADPRTGIVVIRVPAENMDEETWEEIPSVPLSSDWNQEQTQPVIAIGNPVGDMDSLIYGNITSVSGKMNIADAEYPMITTDMAAGEGGGGVLLDMQGQMTGLIISDDGEKKSVIRAVSVARLSPLLEKLTNGEPLCYAGIMGTTISQEQAEQLEIPQGVFVDSVEDGSPAMTAGVQSGDILYQIGDQKISTMWDYSLILQDKNPGDHMTITLYRKNAAGAYVDVELSILIQEK